MTSPQLTAGRLFPWLATGSLITVLSFTSDVPTAAVSEDQFLVEHFWSESYGTAAVASVNGRPRTGRYEWEVIAKAETSVSRGSEIQPTCRTRSVSWRTTLVTSPTRRERTAWPFP